MRRSSRYSTRITHDWLATTDHRGSQQPLHPTDQIGLGRFHHQVKVIAYQTSGMNLPSGLAQLWPTVCSAPRANAIFSFRSHGIPPTWNGSHPCQRDCTHSTDSVDSKRLLTF